MKKTTIVIFLIFDILISLTSMNSIAGVTISDSLINEITLGKAGTREIYQAVIILKNAGEKPQEVKIYQTDCEISSDGKKKYGEPGKMARSNASWITIPKQLTIPAKGTFELNYSIKIPNNKTLVGTYWSTIMVEGIPDISPELKPEKNKMKVGVETKIRYAVQIITNVGDTGTVDLNYINVKLIKEANKRVLQADMGNTGEKMARPLLYVELYNEDGTYAGKFSGEKKRIYPGMSVRFNINLSEVPKGKYKAMVMADCGDDEIFGATYNIECKDEPNTTIDPTPK
jgi:hypothetical protein